MRQIARLAAICVLSKKWFPLPHIVYQLFKVDLGSTIFGEPKQS